ncbi:MAG: glutathione peroxidase [Clostridia bacterium]|nr:glutathione peroxidase [Clostridia bacterium]
MNIYDFSISSASGEEIPMARYKGKVLLIVNTASKCGFAPQYNELQELYSQYGEQKFDILAFPCNQFGHQEPGTNKEIGNFCTLNFGVTFPVMAKIDVNGPTAHPLYKFLQEKSPGILGKSIKWNFTKFLIDEKGNIVARFSPTTSPTKLKDQIEELLKSA